MTECTDGAARSVPVDRLRLGDHTCMDFTDVDARWGVLAAYTRTGLARGEKVMMVLDPSDLNDDDAVSHVDGGTGHGQAARKSGQLVLTRNTSVYLPDGRFSKERQVRTYAAEIERARDEGYPGLRAACDMAWAARAGISEDELVDYESFVEPLFESLLLEPRLASICWYDRQRFSASVVGAMRKVHPLQVMEHLDALDVTRTPGAVRIAGSAELDTREEFTEALRGTLGRRPEHVPLRFDIDLTDLCYMEAHCAWQLIDFAAELPADHQVVVRCGPILEMVLRGLGSDDVPQLELSVEDVEDAEHAEDTEDPEYATDREDAAETVDRA